MAKTAINRKDVVGANLKRLTAASALLSLVLLLLSGQSGVLAQGTVAIVAHPDVPVDNVSFSQVRKIFRGEQQFWPNRQRITLLMRAPEALERDVVLRKIYEMTEGQFRQYWIAKIFRSEVASGPKIVYSTEMAHELVNALPGSISFVLRSDVGDGVKVLRIDGKLPGDSNYPL